MNEQADYQAISLGESERAKPMGEMEKSIRFIDLFCGIGGFRIAAEQAADNIGLKTECVFSSDIDPSCQTAYEANFHERPIGDISKIDPDKIPEHDLLLAGFPCQAFSIIGHRRGFEDTRGTLFFNIASILNEKSPSMFVLENVKMLKGHNGGKTLKKIMEVLREVGYFCDYRILNALDFGLPQKRERIFIVGFKEHCSFNWPKGNIPMKPLSDILESNVPDNYRASEYIRKNRLKKHPPTKEPTIWHENKAGNISVYPYSCALRAGASYNYLLVNGERRLTPREMLRLQGFPDSYKIVCNYSQTRKQAGNSLPVPVAREVITNLLLAQLKDADVKMESDQKNQVIDQQMILFEKKDNDGGRISKTSLR